MAVTHKHKCQGVGCGHIWEHQRPPMSASEEEYKKAHLCPKCGREERNKFILTRKDRENHHQELQEEFAELASQGKTSLGLLLALVFGDAEPGMGDDKTEVTEADRVFYATNTGDVEVKVRKLSYESDHMHRRKAN